MRAQRHHRRQRPWGGSHVGACPWRVAASEAQELVLSSGPRALHEGHCCRKGFGNSLVQASGFGAHPLPVRVCPTATCSVPVREMCISAAEAEVPKVTAVRPPRHPGCRRERPQMQKLREAAQAQTSYSPWLFLGADLLVTHSCVHPAAAENPEVPVTHTRTRPKRERGGGGTSAPQNGRSIRKTYL